MKKNTYLRLIKEIRKICVGYECDTYLGTSRGQGVWPKKLLEFSEEQANQILEEKSQDLKKALFYIYAHQDKLPEGVEEVLQEMILAKNTTISILVKYLHYFNNQSMLQFVTIMKDVFDKNQMQKICNIFSMNRTFLTHYAAFDVLKILANQKNIPYISALCTFVYDVEAFQKEGSLYVLRLIENCKSEEIAHSVRRLACIKQLLCDKHYFEILELLAATEESFQEEYISKLIIENSTILANDSVLDAISLIAHAKNEECAEIFYDIVTDLNVLESSWLPTIYDYLKDIDDEVVLKELYAIVIDYDILSIGILQDVFDMALAIKNPNILSSFVDVACYCSKEIIAESQEEYFNVLKKVANARSAEQAYAIATVFVRDLLEYCPYSIMILDALTSLQDDRSITCVVDTLDDTDLPLLLTIQTALKIADYETLNFIMSTIRDFKLDTDDTILESLRKIASSNEKEVVSLETEKLCLYLKKVQEDSISFEVCPFGDAMEKHNLDIVEIENLLQNISPEEELTPYVLVKVRK